ncbi:hypothetical protein [Marinifilum sp. D737]|uniref:hypothetical protein n=1 Tax=Marinifilum sp. D737 TaxID=2969628 RepID=UPI0022728CAF|nr:hypothetical protein [Marinifilum sp. D737]MCY1635000.1 hypothetical protein [Marinifilum sp. D737]
MKFFNLSLLTAVLCTLLNVNTNAQTVIKSRYILKDNMFAKSILSGGISTGSEYDGQFGLQGMYDYRVSERFSLGAQGNLYAQESDLSEGNFWTLNLRSNYHFLKQHKINPNHWDWYIGVDLGVDANGLTDIDPEAFVGAHMGLRYKINHRWIAFIEAGSRNTCVGLALNLR